MTLHKESKSKIIISLVEKGRSRCLERGNWASKRHHSFHNTTSLSERVGGPPLLSGHTRPGAWQGSGVVLKGSGEGDSSPVRSASLAEQPLRALHD